MTAWKQGWTDMRYSVWDSAWDSMWHYSVGDSIRDSVRDSVREFTYFDMKELS